MILVLVNYINSTILENKAIKLLVVSCVEFGIGYQWKPSNVTIKVGDKVKVIF